MLKTVGAIIGIIILTVIPDNVINDIAKRIMKKIKIALEEKQDNTEIVDTENKGSVTSLEETNKTDIIENIKNKLKQSNPTGGLRILRYVAYAFSSIAAIIDIFMIFTHKALLSVADYITGFFVLFVFLVLISAIMLSLIGNKDKDKNMTAYCQEKGAFLWDKHFWILTSVFITTLLTFSSITYSGQSSLLFITILVSMFIIPIYLIYSAGFSLFSGDIATALHKKPAIPRKPVAIAPKKPVEVIPVTIMIDDLHQMCGNLEDAELVKNIQEIINYTKAIEEGLVKYPDARKGELVLEYNTALLKFLHTYNEAEDLRLGNKVSLDMMENTQAYARDLVLMLRDILERIYEANAETIDANIEVLRTDMRLRGYVKGGKR